jgi:hypothetical protein
MTVQLARRGAQLPELRNLYTTTVTPTATANDARLHFWVGDAPGSVWLDGVQMSPSPTLFRRYFTNGVVLLNGAVQCSESEWALSNVVNF